MAIDCCDGFSSTTTSAERETGELYRDLDDCGNKAIYNAPAATQFYKFMPVKFVAGTPGRVTPALDGVDAIGFSNEDKLTVGAGAFLSVTRTGHVKWADVAAAIGASAASQAAWWPIHIALAKANIYVEFN